MSCTRMFRVARRVVYTVPMYCARVLLPCNVPVLYSTRVYCSRAFYLQVGTGYVCTDASACRDEAATKFLACQPAGGAPREPSR